MKKVIMGIVSYGKAAINTVLNDEMTKIIERAQNSGDLIKEYKTETVITTSNFETLNFDKKAKRKKGKYKKNWEK